MVIVNPYAKKRPRPAPSAIAAPVAIANRYTKTNASTSANLSGGVKLNGSTKGSIHGSADGRVVGRPHVGLRGPSVSLNTQAKAQAQAQSSFHQQQQQTLRQKQRPIPIPTPAPAVALAKNVASSRHHQIQNNAAQPMRSNDGKRNAAHSTTAKPYVPTPNLPQKTQASKPTIMVPSKAKLFQPTPFLQRSYQPKNCSPSKVAPRMAYTPSDNVPMFHHRPPVSKLRKIQKFGETIGEARPMPSSESTSASIPSPSASKFASAPGPASASCTTTLVGNTVKPINMYARRPASNTPQRTRPTVAGTQAVASPRVGTAGATKTGFSNDTHQPPSFGASPPSKGQSIQQRQRQQQQYVKRPASTFASPQRIATFAASKRNTSVNAKQANNRTSQYNPNTYRQSRMNTSNINVIKSFRPAQWNTTKTNPPAQPHQTQQQQRQQQQHNRPGAPVQRLEIEGESLIPREIYFAPNSFAPVDDGYRTQLIKHADVTKPLLNGWTLYPHQKRAIVMSLRWRRIILALDMGLGKTLIGCVWARAFKRTFDNIKVFVICPVSLKMDWKRTAEAATGLAVEDLEPNKKKKKKTKTKAKTKNDKNGANSADTDNNGNLLNGSDEDEKPAPSIYDLQICSWAKIPKSVDGSIERYIVVCDEAHSIQSMTSTRTKDALSLVDDKRCAGVLLLTGTPMKNGKPLNLFPLLKAIRHPFGRHQKAYERHFCAGQERFVGRGTVWDANGASNLKQLHRLIAPILLYTTKEDCLKDLPPMKRETRHVPVSSRCQIQYMNSVKELHKIYNASRSEDTGTEAVLGGTQRLRLTCAKAKISAAVETSKQLLLKDTAAIVIFTNFVQVAKTIKKQLEEASWSVEILTGETPSNKRHVAVDNFQNGLSSVFVCTFGAGGVGLTLTAASTIILLDRPWTPGETRQAEDRVRRIGQTREVTSIWMSAFDLDDQLDRMLESKTKTSDVVLVNGELPLATSRAKISIPQLLTRLFASPKLGAQLKK